MQALANLAEFKSLKKAVGKKMRIIYQGEPKPEETSPLPVAINLSVSMIGLIWVNLVLLFRVTKAVARICAGGEEKGVQLAQFLRLAEVWGILAIGSILALATAVIQLRLAMK